MIYTDEMDGIDRWLMTRWMDLRIRKAGADAPFPGDILPRSGLAARDGHGNTLAVATLYLEREIPVAVCGWCAANPLNNRRQSAEAVKTLLAAIPVYARRCGAKYLLTTFGQRSLNRMLDRLGFSNGDVAETKIKVL